MDVDHVFVMFCSEGGGPFLPVAREDIPDWLRDDDVIQKMLEGNVAKKADENPQTLCSWSFQNVTGAVYRLASSVWAMILTSMNPSVQIS